MTNLLDADLIKKHFLDELVQAQKLDEVEQLRLKYLGKKGEITTLLQKISQVPLESRKSYGSQINLLKAFILEEISSVKNIIKEKELSQELKKDVLDVSLPARNYLTGGASPISQVIRDVCDIFNKMGFMNIGGPEIEDDWHNFTALNIPESHPARQMHDTFYFEDNSLLRTHTSSVQVRYMNDNQPPARIISVGRVYRADDDATHTPMFHQIEGLCIDKDINMGNLKHVLESFLQQFFELRDVPTRFRPSFFPFTEPSAEVDIKCDRSNKSSIKIGKGNDWLEILGCGMVHPNVLKNMGIDHNEYRGFAFGIGIERLAMLKYNIPDLRTLFTGSIALDI